MTWRGEEAQSCRALACYGVGTSTGMVTYNSLLQAEVPSQNRGRVFAGYDMVWQTGRLASLAAGGVTADTLGIQAVYVLGGILLMLAGTIGLAGLRPVKLPPRAVKPGPCFPGRSGFREPPGHL